MDRATGQSSQDHCNFWKNGLDPRADEAGSHNRQYQVEPAAVEAIAQRMRETITHHFSQILPGFVEYCLIDGGNGRLVALGIFADAGVAAAAGQVAAG